MLGRLAVMLGEGDGTGHESAGSARIPASREAEFLRLLEDELG
jgi:nanoRNase/pAp phosphatase (c-di-AMP/oligoRNAs hydrolase)